MKANELRIGNLVFNHKGKPIQILEWIGNEAYLTEGRKAYGIKTSSPIPLSNEWFDRFDWRNGFHKGLLMRVGTQINLFGKIMPIDYVHELQNLYYTLHKEEL